MEQLGTAIQSFLDDQLIPLASVVIIAALVIIGFACVGGTQKLVDWAKGHIYHVIAGAILIYLASNIATSFISSLGYTF